MGHKFNDQTVKYQLNLSISVDGIVSESDIVGALFGQTEGLLDEQLELKQLQKSGRIGRIDFKINTKSGVSNGVIAIPSSLNKINTAILAATLETVERVGPCACSIKLEKIVDVRGAKRDQIAKRASEIMKRWNVESQSESANISKYVEKDTRKGKIVVFGPDKLNAGPEIFKSHEIVVVEGRADIVNLLKMGIENTIALDGTKVPSTIKNLCKNRKVTVLLDGDRGADMILKELVLTTDIDYVARAPFRKEVEDLSLKEVEKALDNKIPMIKAKFISENLTIQEFLDNQSPRDRKSHYKKPSMRRTDRTERPERPERSDRKDRDRREKRPTQRSDQRSDQRSPRRDSKRFDSRDRKFTRRGRDNDRPRRRRVEVPKEIKELINKIKQTSTALFLGKKHETISSVSTSEAFEQLQKSKGVESIIIDGVITQRILDVANEKSIKLIAGAVVGDLSNRHKIPEIATFNRI